LVPLGTQFASVLRMKRSERRSPAGSLACTACSSAGVSIRKPGSASTVCASISASHCGCRQSPVPSRSTPFRCAQSAMASSVIAGETAEE